MERNNELPQRVGYTEESPGVKSSTRLVFVVGAFYILALAGYMVYVKSGGPVEISAFIVSGIGALGGVKYFGTKNEVDK